MKTFKLTLIIILIIPGFVFSQSIINIEINTELEIGQGAEVCADIQSGNGILSGTGTFCGGLLPVELVSFTSETVNRDVLLKWTTATEENNSGFEIERSSGLGHTWTKIGFTAGHGNSTTPIDYTYKDKSLNAGKYNYRLKQIDFNGNQEFFNLENEINIGVPVKYHLAQNFPNPFNPSTTIQFDIPFDSKVAIKIFDMTGKEVSTLINENMTAGYHEIKFNSNSVSSGLTSGAYFYKISADGNGQKFIQTKKMMLLK